MLYKRRHHFLLLCLISITVFACGQPTPEPEIASSAELSGYAIAYPDKLGSLNETYRADSAEAREIFQAFAKHPDELKDPDWNQVLNVTVRADEEGRSSSYAYRIDESRNVQEFFDEEKDDIARRVSGAVDAQAKKVECDCELDAYGKVVYSLNESVNKQLDKRLKIESESARLIERYEKSLGKKNSGTLEKQAGFIARASYIVFVGLPELWNYIDRLACEERKVKRTLENALEAEREFSAHPEVSKSEKKASEKRISELEKALSSIDATVEAANKIISEGQEGIPAIRREYEDAFDKLCDEISKRASENRQ
jgi:hypothetical protein